MSNIRMFIQKIQICTALTLVCFASQVMGQSYSVNINLTAQQIVQGLVGEGVQISNVVVTTCNDSTYGFYNSVNTELGTSQGLLMTTGKALYSIGPNNAIGNCSTAAGTCDQFDNGCPGSTLLNQSQNRVTRDATTIQFDIVPQGDSLKFKYTFASEEYNEWVNSPFNDVFGFYISGPNIGNNVNIALVPTTGQVVSINTVNLNQNSQFFYNNQNPFGQYVQYDGFTRNLVAKIGGLTPCVPYTLKLIIADGTDRLYDSAVFIESIESNPVAVATTTSNGLNYLTEGCSVGSLTFSRQFPSSLAQDVTFWVGGTATNGVDFIPSIGNVPPLTPQTISIPANQTSVTINVTAPDDGIAEGQEFFTIYLADPVCSGPVLLDSINFFINDRLDIDLLPDSAAICLGECVNLELISEAASLGSFTWSQNVPNPFSPNNTVCPNGAETYIVTVTAGNCVSTDSITIRPQEIEVILTSTPALCAGSATGSVAVASTDGQPPVTYQWAGPNSFNSTLAVNSNVLPGQYCLTATDGNDCQGVACTQVSINPTPPYSLSLNVTDAACIGSASGSIQSIVSGADNPLTFAWSGPNGFTAASPNITALEVGQYCLQFADATGCQTQVCDFVEISAPAQPNFTFTPSPRPSCPTASNGGLNVSITGLSGSLTFAWSGPNGYSSSQQNISGLTGGQYFLTVTDGFGCTYQSQTSLVPFPSSNAVINLAETNTTCPNATNGALNATIIGANTPIQNFSWSGPNGFNASTEDIVNIANGQYCLTITDAVGCTANNCAIITNDPFNPEIQFTSVPTTCATSSDGSISATVTGLGAGTITYLWSGSAGSITGNSNTISSQLPGQYCVTALSSNGCSAQGCGNILQGNGASVSIDFLPTPPACAQSNSGALLANVVGTTPVTFTWTEANGTFAGANNPVTGLLAGQYCVEITDNIGCVYSECTNLIPNTDINIPFSFVIENSSCPGINNGSIAATVPGAQSFSWTGPNGLSSQSNTIANLQPGQYCLTVTDNNNCTDDSCVFVLANPFNPSISLTSVPTSCVLSADGTATAEANGFSSTELTYVWTSGANFIGTGETIGNLATGNYCVEITDQNNCSAEQCINVTAGNGSDVNFDFTTIAPSCLGSNSGSISVVVTGATGALTYSWTGGNLGSPATSSSVSGLIGGNYTLVVTDALGCQYSADQALIPNTQINPIFDITVTNLSCPGADNGSLTLNSVSNAGSIASIEWTFANTPISSDSTISDLASGLYTLNIVDVNGCEAENSIFVTVSPFNPTIQLTSTPSSCLLVADGSLQVLQANLSAPIVSYSWTGNTGNELSQTLELNNVPAGEYCVEITDANNCSSEECATVNNSNDQNLTLQLTPSATFCQGSNSGTISGLLSGANGDVTFAWSGPNGFAVDTNTASLGSLQAGEYCITATDALGCFVESCSTVTEPSESTISIDFTNLPGFCERSEDGQINVTVNGGSTPLTFSWQGPDNFQSNAANLSSIISGIYCLNVTDADGCQANACDTLESINSNVIAINTSVSDASCIGSEDGAIDGTISGNTGNTSILWTGPQNFTSNTLNLTAIANGVYCVEIVDELGCLAEACDTVETSGQGDFNLNITVSDVNCSGPSSGSISANASTNNLALSFEWFSDSILVGNNASLSNISEGVYCVIATDPSGCQSSACDTVGIDFTSGTTLNFTLTDLSCPGSDDGSISVNASPSGNYSYSWQYPNGILNIGADIFNLAVGEYCVTANSNSNGCSADSCVTIGSGDGDIALTFAVIPAQCGDNGQILTTISGSTSPVISWTGNNFFSSSEDLSNLSAGAYQITVTDGLGCTADSIVVVDELPASPFNISFTSTPTTCAQSEDGSVSISAPGASTPLTISWTSPLGIVGAGPSVTNAIAGEYCFVVIDSRGCQENACETIEVSQNSSFNVTLTVTDVSCNGANNGSITASVDGPASQYDFIWQGPNGYFNTGNPITNLAQGEDYCVSVIDPSGCTGSNCADVNLSSSLPFQISILKEDRVCSDNGTLNLEVNGAAQPITALWSDANSIAIGSGSTITNLGVGTYCVEVTDANGCVLEQCEDIIDQQPAPFGIQFTSVPETCEGAGNGSLTFVAPAAEIPLLITSWSGPNGFESSSSDINSLVAGEYCLTLVDSRGCAESDACAEVTSNSTPIEVTTFPIAPSCATSEDGSITATLINASGNYTFEWTELGNIIGTSASLENIGAGTYCVTATDQNGCSSEEVCQILNASGNGLEVTITVVPQQCPESASGSAIASVTGAEGNIDYFWSGTDFFSNNDSITDLLAGAYNLSVSDAAGCSFDTTINITLLTSPVVSALLTASSAACANSSSGSIAADVTGANAPFNFLWSGPNGFTSLQEDLSALDAGDYCLIVRDAVGCFAAEVCAEVLVNEEQFIFAFADPSNASVCAGGDNGSIDLTVVGASSGYAVQWAGPNAFNSTNEDIINLIPGEYCVIVTDGNGCSSDTTCSIVGQTSASNFTAAISSTDAFCAGSSSGTMTVTFDGAVEPVSISWSGVNDFSSTEAVIEDLEVGTYCVSIVDGNGCQSNACDSIEISAISPLAANFLVDPANCVNSSTGGIIATLNGGISPIDISWTGPAGYSSTGNLSISNLDAGVYTLTVQDASGCSFTGDAEVGVSDISPIEIVLFSNTITCDDANTGQVTTIIGSEAPVTIEWTGPQDFTSNQANLINVLAGTYCISVTDNTGCFAEDCIDVVEENLFNVVSSTSDYSCNQISCFGLSDGHVALDITGGVEPYNVVWTGTNGFSASTDSIGGLFIGTYNVLVTDAEGCSYSNSYTLTQPDFVTLNAVGQVDLLCNGVETGEATVLATGGCQPYTYIWSHDPAVQGPVALNLDGGNYSVNVIDRNGCVNSASVEITISEPIAPITTILTDVTVYPGDFNVTCNGSLDGGATAVASGGTPPYTYQWINNDDDIVYSTSETLSGAPAGNYSYYAFDSLGCISEEIIFNLLQPEPMEITSLITNNACGGGDFGLGAIEISETTGGHAGGYTYEWNGPDGFTSSEEDLTGLNSGIYTLYVFDAQDCPDTFFVSVAANDQFVTSFNQINPLCEGVCNGSIEVFASLIDSTVVLPPFTYEWRYESSDSNSFNETSSADSLCSGLYFVTAAAGNCSETMVIPLIDPAGLFIDTTLVDRPLCVGSEDGAINIEVSNGSGFYTYSWTADGDCPINNPTNPNISQLFACTYTVEVTDTVLGCVASKTINLNAPVAIEIVSIIPSLYDGGFNIGCNGANDGSLSAFVIGGTPDANQFAPFLYSYDWTGEASPNCAGSSFDPADYGNPANTSFINNIPAGTLSLTVTDVNGCFVTTCVNLTEPDPLTSPGTTTAVDCNNLSGCIIPGISGGSGNYISYEWTGGIGNNSPDADTLCGLNPELYTLTVTDANNCQETFEYELIEFSAPEIDFVVVQSDVSCFNICDASAYLEINGGTGVRTLTLDGDTLNIDLNGDSLQFTLNNLCLGEHILVLSDANGCNDEETFEIQGPTPIDVILDDIVQVIGQTYSLQCYGDNNGAINLTPVSGAGPLGYIWTNASGDTLANSQDIFSLSAGVYNVEVSDVIGCSENFPYEITQPDTSIGFEFITTDYFGYAVSCPGASDGAIDISVTGGMEPYFYSWQSNANSTEFDEDQIDLSAGLYQVLIIDANYCTYTSEPILILSTPEISIAPTTVVNNICFDVCEGSIEITPSDTGFVYSWAGADEFASSEANISGLCSGDYTLTVTNSYNCEASFDFSITEPESDAILIEANYNCDEGYADLCAFIQSVNGPFSYEWNTLDTTSCISVVGQSEFCISVTDANGCVNQNCITTNPTEAIEVISTVTPTTCNNCNGGIDIETNGGTGVLTFSWSNGSGAEDQADLCSGSYTLSISDEANCIIERTIDVSSSVGMSVETNISNISCVNLTDGSGSVTVTGGLAPIITQWFDASDTLLTTGENISSLSAGNYQVVVTSADGCVDSTDFIVEIPTAISLQVTVSQYGDYNLSLFESGDGTIDVTATGGVGGYEYIWNPAIAGDSVSSLQQLAAGEYNLTVQDSNGCKVDTLITLTEPFKLEVYTALSPNGDGINDVYIIDGSWACSGSIFKVFNRWGSLVFEKKDYQDDWFGQHSDGSLLSDGTYFIVYEGCQKEFSTYVDLRRE